MIETVPCTIAHLRALAATILAEKPGDDHGRLMPALWYSTPEPRAAMRDGRIIAAWGDSAPILSSEGCLWFFTAAEAMVPALIRKAKQEVRRMLVSRETIRAGLHSPTPACIRFYRAIGFQIDGADLRMDRELTITRQLRNEAAENSAPFIIFALPRSRTAWLSKFLSYGRWTCLHEFAMRLRSIADLKAALSQPRIGYVETAAGPGHHLIRYFRPDARLVVVRRPVEETVTAMVRAGHSVGISYDERRLKKVMAYGERCLERISALPGVLTVTHQDLSSTEVCRRIFEHCLPYRWDQSWWESLHQQHIEVDLGEHFARYRRDKPAIDIFKSLCRAELSRLRRRGEIHA